jgi:pilus assembly protein CpaB
MRLVFGLVLILGLGLAGFAVYMARGYIGSYQAQLALERAARGAVVPTRDIFIVTRQIGYGELLKVEDLAILQWPEVALPEGVFFTEEELFPLGRDVPRTVLRMMEPNETILKVKVTEPGENAGVSSRLSAGMRAFTIRVDVSTGVSGFLRPGDRVDVYWSGRTPSGNVTKLIETSVTLLAVDQVADMDRITPTIARTVTTEVTPAQVAILAQAQSSGRLSLSLVGAREINLASAVEVDQNALLGVTYEAPAQVVAERVCTITTRRGAEILKTPIPCTN